MVPRSLSCVLTTSHGGPFVVVAFLFGFFVFSSRQKSQFSVFLQNSYNYGAAARRLFWRACRWFFKKLRLSFFGFFCLFAPFGKKSVFFFCVWFSSLSLFFVFSFVCRTSGIFYFYRCSSSPCARFSSLPLFSFVSPVCRYFFIFQPFFKKNNFY